MRVVDTLACHFSGLEAFSMSKREDLDMKLDMYSVFVMSLVTFM